MNRITKRAGIMLVFIAVLLGGMGFFLFEYATQAHRWVVSTGSPHVYSNGNIGCGYVTDREGLLLLDTRDGREYSADAHIRRATLHWVGDRAGNISAGAVASYALQMAGYDPVDGVYEYAGAGGNAQLTLSARVQTAALEAMGEYRGTVAVYNYKTGQVLCAVTNPTFDPDDVPDLTDSAAFEGVYVNRFLQSAYIPGSIFKVVTAAAALDCVDGIEQMSFTCRGVLEYGVDRVTCETAHGTQSLKTALANSCNCAFAQIAQLVGNEAMMDYAECFGISSSISFDGISTAAGNYDVTDAAPVELAWSCIGQYTDQINPCVFLTFMGAVANDGQAVLPYVVERITVGEEVTYQAQTQTGERIMTAEIAGKLQDMMGYAVDAKYGAGNFYGLSVCAKSGTSQLGGDQISNAMFAGFVRDEAYPLAFVVVLENAGYGATACVPLISQVLLACRMVLDGQK